MGSGDIVVGKNASTRKSASASLDDLAKGTGAPAPIQAIPGNGERHCGAMAHQRGDNGAVSTPQKFLHLVGCRDPKARGR